LSKIKSIVIYNSRGGNTKKVAEKIAEGLGTEAVKSRKRPNLSDYQLVVLGTWVLAAKLSPGGNRYLSKIPAEQLENTKVAMFISAAGPDDSPMDDKSNDKTNKELVFQQFEDLLTSKGADVVDERHASMGVFRFFRFGPGFKPKGHPNEEDLAEAKAFGESLKKYL
jgi:flavodoxin